MKIKKKILETHPQILFHLESDAENSEKNSGKNSVKKKEKQ